MTALETDGPLSESDEELRFRWTQVGRNTAPERLKALEEGAEPCGSSEEAYVRTFRSMRSRQLIH